MKIEYLLVGGTVDDMGIVAVSLKSRSLYHQLSRTISIPISFGT